MEIATKGASEKYVSQDFLDKLSTINGWYKFVTL